MHEENKALIKVHDIILDFHLGSQKQACLEPTLVDVFFHDLMVYASNYLFAKNSSNKDLYNFPVSFPYINSAYTDSPFKITFSSPKQNRKRALYNSFFSLCNFIGYKRKSLAIGTSCHLDKNKLIGNLWGRQKIYFPYIFLLYVKDINFSVTNLRKCLQLIAGQLHCSSQLFIDNFLCYAESHLTTKKPKLYDSVVVSANTSLENRILSANHFYNGKRVVLIHHGEQNPAILNEPVMGYSELAFCTDVISYGKAELPRACYQTLLTPKPKFWFRNAPNCKKIFEEKIPFKTKNYPPKLLYIPTSSSNCNRYGPFRDFEEGEYLAWQKKLASSVPNLYIKPHPNFNNPAVQHFCGVESKPISECLKGYDGCILDYVSTASAECMASNLPILYFDIGLRNLHPDVVDSFMKRVQYIKIGDVLDVKKELLLQCWNYFNTPEIHFENIFTPQYCLSNNPLSVEELIVHIIE